jgi:DNA topoisomerase-1
MQRRTNKGPVTTTKTKRPARSGTKNTTTSAPAEASASRNGGSRRKHARNLVIVESPAKARTVANILGDDYAVIASVGHVRDLPAYGYGLEDFESFQPKWVVVKDKRRGVDKSDVIKDVATAARSADRVFLSTDPDREGEAIAWHVREAAGIPEEKSSRVVFHEITKPAIEEAFEHPGKLNMHLVDAQQTRRVLDRLIGFPLTWFVQGKVSKQASAGRVQSVALRLIVEREREIQRFAPQEYWTIHALLGTRAGAAEQGQFVADLARLPGERTKPEIGSADAATRLIDTFKRSDFVVSSVKKSERKKSPVPPFTTSTFQQAANNRLGMTASRAMSAAQQLYEGISLPGEGPVGLITYMRTDSLNISPVARGEARRYVRSRWGEDHVPEKERVYRTRAKGAQEAHEAIRPTSPSRTPESLREVLSHDQMAVYRLIWQRFLASQMSDARFNTVAVEVEAKESGELRGTFRASAQKLVFAGHMAVYGTHASELASPDEDEDAEASLPELTAGQALDRRDVDGTQHFTEPPPRFTEASLVKALEELGIGRPSTYATIVQTVQKRDYVKREGRALVPQELGFLVNDLLVQHVERYVAPGFTSAMESQLDEIAEGKAEYLPVVKEFWGHFEKDLESAKATAEKQQQETDILCTVCGRANMVIKWGRNGKFLACPRYPECKNAMPLTQEGEPVPVSGPELVEDIRCPKCGGALLKKAGPYGPYVDCEHRDDGSCDFRAGVPVGIACPEEPGTGQLVQKKTARGEFYGCWNYPKCSYTTKSIEPGKMTPARSPEEREEANRKLLERSARGKAAFAKRRANATGRRRKAS